MVLGNRHSSAKTEKFKTNLFIVNTVTLVEYMDILVL